MKKILTAVMFMLLSMSSFAQRTVVGQMFLQAGIEPARQNEFSAGVGQYRTNGFWFADVTFAYDRVDKKDMTLGANGGYLWRLAANSRRSLNLYGGVAGAVSYHNINPHEVFLEHDIIEEDTPITYFYSDRDIRVSAMPVLAFEFFPFKSVALFVSAYAPCQFSAPVADVKKARTSEFSIFVEGSVGLRILL